MKQQLLSGVLAAALVALVGSTSVAFAAERASSRLWSIVVHLAYADGTAYDYVIATGVPAQEMSSYLAECGKSHKTGSVVRYHCYPVPE